MLNGDSSLLQRSNFSTKERSLMIRRLRMDCLWSNELGTLAL